MNISLKRISVVLFKEVMDNLRDRRSIFSAMISSLIGPGILLLLIIIVGKTIFQETSDPAFDLFLSGGENAPSLVQFFEQSGANILPAPPDPPTAVVNGDVDIVVIIPAGYAENFTGGNPATIQLVYDSTRQSAIASIERVRNLLEGYGQQIASMRLLARGISPAITYPLAIENVDLATPQTQALIFLNMMPYFIVMVVFMGGMYVIIDTTAGERERGSLEPLLINPVTRTEFVLGKMGASIPFAVVTLIFNLIAFAVAFNAFPLEEYLGFQLSIDIMALFKIFLIALPMILLASALQMIIATYTRSFKEAQTYVGFLPLIPALPGIGLAFLPVKSSLVAMLIPTFGQQLLINQVLRSEYIQPANVVVSTIVTLLVSVALIYVAIRQYHHERIIFGTR